MLFAAESFIFLLVALVVLTLLCDEEPVLDVTDLNVLHVVILTSSLLIVVYDNFVKASMGQFGDSDRQSAVYVAVKSFAMLLYFFIVCVGFFAHSMPPMSADAVEGVLMWSVFNSTLTSTLLRPVLALVALRSALAVALAAAPSRLRSASIVVGSLFASAATALVAWELVVRALTSATSATDVPTSAKSTAATTYASGADFEWHKASTAPTMWFFIDTASTLSLVFVLLVAALATLATQLAVVGGVLGNRVWAELQPLLSYSASMLTNSLVFLVMNYLVLSSFFVRSLVSTSCFSWL